MGILFEWVFRWIVLVNFHTEIRCCIRIPTTFCWCICDSVSPLIDSISFQGKTIAWFFSQTRQPFVSRTKKIPFLNIYIYLWFRLEWFYFYKLMYRHLWKKNYSSSSSVVLLSDTIFEEIHLFVSLSFKNKERFANKKQTLHTHSDFFNPSKCESFSGQENKK